MKKKLLFVINTLSQAGAETALIELLRVLANERNEDGVREYDIDLYVLMGQGELAKKLPGRVRLLNDKYSYNSVLSDDGKKDMIKHIVFSMLKRGSVFKNFLYIISNYIDMKRAGHIWKDKLLWRVISDGSDLFDTEYDLAAAYLEGGSAYYVADHVKAKKKAAFIHIDYTQAGYTRKLDKECYKCFDMIFPISDEVRDKFVEVYPEYEKKVRVFHNVINQKNIKDMALLEGGFNDEFSGKRILTVGRLTYQKAYPLAVEAMRLLKEDGFNVRWYVLGEGPERASLEQQIRESGLINDFILLGAVENPYPYYKQTDLYVHATRFEGKSIAIQEAQTLGCAVIASDSNGNREQIEDGKDGLLCVLDALSIKEAISSLLKDNVKRMEFGRKAALKKITYDNELQLLTGMMTD